MNFVKFRDAFKNHAEAMANTAKTKLFDTMLTPEQRDELYTLYLASFPAEHNQMFRSRLKMDCTACRHFIKKFGGAVAIAETEDGYELETMWHFGFDDPEYGQVTKALDAYVKSFPVQTRFYTESRKVGTPETIGMSPDGKPEKWEHLYTTVPAEYVWPAAGHGEKRGKAKSDFDVFYRALREITPESTDTLLELIAQNSLYRGAEHKNTLTSFRAYQTKFAELSSEEEEILAAWYWTTVAPMAITHIRNTSIGTLLVNLSEGMDLETAVGKYEQITAPANYKRPKAIFTQKMLDDAKKKLEEAGYMSSLGRRFARLDDVTVNNVLFADRSVRPSMKNAGADDIFAEMAKDTKKSPMKFDRAEEIPAEKFISDVLPTAKTLEVYLENKHRKNLVSLIAPKDPEAPGMFKWDNAFSWAYTGNVADSDIRQNVAKAGGDVTGFLRFSIQWNDDKTCSDDLDAHCRTPNGEIYFSNKRIGSGMLDVDIICPYEEVAVENITWPTASSIPDGTYTFFVHCYNRRSGDNRFRAEIELDGTVYEYTSPHIINDNDKMFVAAVTKKNGVFSITHQLNPTESQRTMWNLQTNQFVPVSLVCHSPNYWDQNSGCGNKHTFFLLKDCRNPDLPNGFFNEYLKNDLLEHKRVFEALGTRMAVEPDNNQLSGIGFSETLRAEVVVRVTGAAERVLKVKF